jgi:hypothetical protein
MQTLKVFAPTHLREAATASGFLQCPTCGLVWLGKSQGEKCPEGQHSRPDHIAVICRQCGIAVTPETSHAHAGCARKHLLGSTG